MDNEKFYAKTLCGIAFCLCFIIYGTVIFIKSEQIDYYTCMYLFKRIVPYSIIVAVLGYYTGNIIDSSNKKKRKKRKNL